MDRYFYEEASRSTYKLFDRRRNVSEPIAYGLDAEMAQRITDLLNADDSIRQLAAARAKEKA